MSSPLTSVHSKQAARNAGINPVKLIKEPEAAALFTIHSMGEKGLDVNQSLCIPVSN